MRLTKTITMFSVRRAKRYCQEYWLIENYEKALNSAEKWVIHHRKEDVGFSQNELIERNLYYNRPPEELVFMSQNEHQRHHNLNMRVETRKKISDSKKGHVLSEESRKKISEKNKGKKSPWKGMTHSEETRKKISEKTKGRTPWNKGGHQTEEAKEKNRQAHLGKKHTEEARKKIGESHKGMRHTEEARRKMSEKHKGRIVSEETRRKISKSQIGKRMGSESSVARPIYQLNKKTNEVIREFDCTQTASRELNILDSCIYNCLRGRSKSAGGYLFCYVEDYSDWQKVCKKKPEDIKPLF